MVKVTAPVAVSVSKAVFSGADKGGSLEKKETPWLKKMTSVTNRRTKITKASTKTFFYTYFFFSTSP